MQNNHKLENIEKLCSQLHLSLNKNDGKTEVVFFGRQLHHDYLKPLKIFNKEKVPKCFTKLLGLPWLEHVIWEANKPLLQVMLSRIA